MKCTYSLQQIIRSSRLRRTIRLLKTLPDAIIDSIRSVRLVLGRHDVRCDGCMAFEYDERWNVLFNYTRHSNHCHFYRCELLSRWWDAASFVLTLEVQHLVFDVRDAYSMEGRWLGSDWTKRFIPPYSDLPRKLEVIAPNLYLEKLILDEIRTSL